MATPDRTQSGTSSSGSTPVPQMDRSFSPAGGGAPSRDGTGGAPTVSPAGSDSASSNVDRGQVDRRTPGDRRAKVAEAAYYRAERRGFASGNEDADWYDAEQEIDRLDNNSGGDWDKTE